MSGIDAIQSVHQLQPCGRGLRGPVARTAGALSSAPQNRREPRTGRQSTGCDLPGSGRAGVQCEPDGDHPRLSDALGYYARTLAAVGRTDEARAALERKIDISERLVREDPVDAFWNARGQVGRVLLATEIYHQGDTPGAVRLLDQAEAGLNDLLAEDRNRDTVALHLAYVASSRAYFAIDDPTRALEFLEEGFDTLEARLGDEEGGAVLFDYYVRAVILEAAVRHQAGLPAPEDRIERALELMRERGEPDQSVADAAALALLELAGGLDDRGAAQFARFDGKGYRAVFYRSMRERLTS